LYPWLDFCGSARGQRERHGERAEVKEIFAFGAEVPVLDDRMLSENGETR